MDFKVVIKERYKLINRLLDETTKECNIKEAKLKNVELTIKDIQHYIELNADLGTVAGFKQYKLLRETLRERRELINEINISNTFRTAYRHETVEYQGKAKENLIEKQIKFYDTPDERDYTVRILKKEYGNIIKKTHK